MADRAIIEGNSPNKFVVPEHFVNIPMQVFTRDLVLASTMNRDYDVDFQGAVGDTITVRVPGVVKAETRNIKSTDPRTPQYIRESTVQIPIKDNILLTTPLTDYERTLELQDFTRQVLIPQVQAAAEKIEDWVIDNIFSTIPHGKDIEWDLEKPTSTFLAVRKRLRELGFASNQGMYAVIGTEIAYYLMNSNILTNFYQSNQTDTLRKGVIGDLYGFTVIEDNRIGPTTGYFYGRSSAILVLRAPSIPMGVDFATTVSANGVAFRYMNDYFADTTINRSLLDVYIGGRMLGMKRWEDEQIVTPALCVTDIKNKNGQLSKPPNTSTVNKEKDTLPKENKFVKSH